MSLQRCISRILLFWLSLSGVARLHSASLIFGRLLAVVVGSPRPVYTIEAFIESVLVVSEPSRDWLGFVFAARVHRRCSNHILVGALLALAGTSEVYGNTLDLRLRHRMMAPEPLLGTGFGDSVEVFGNFLAISEPNRPDLSSGIRAAGQGG
jgi:hypothetical protein